MNANLPETKVGLLDKEVNNLTKILFALVVLLSLVMVLLKRINVQVERNDLWAYIFQVLKEMIRFVLLFSYIIPISLRVNLDLAKISYSLLISRDKKIPKTIVRNSTIPEELGRISYLLSDKTGTLTNNIMKFKQVHFGCAFFNDKFDEVAAHLKIAYSNSLSEDSLSRKIKTTVEAVALCHNVTPIEENEKIVYQAASPDEIALVEWTEKVGIKLALHWLNGQKKLE
uniref:Uncharacterized protein n=1 Tax=Panagrolaimus davidi TaxID=227884 RepID=A0A914Q7A0_9BILA